MAKTKKNSKQLVAAKVWLGKLWLGTKQTLEAKLWQKLARKLTL
jgi:hypothetical protein